MMLMNIGKIITLSTLAIFCSLAFAAELPKPNPLKPEKNYRLETVVSEVEVPWGMALLPNGDLLYSERSGQLMLVKKGQLKGVEVQGMPSVRARGQGGLLDVKLHPNYKNNGWIYFSYSSLKGGNGSNTAILRAKLKNNELVSQELIYKGMPNSSSGHHFGSRIAFDKQGYLFFSIGDRGDRDANPQDLGRDGGKIYRLHDDGRVPEDNPFINQEGIKPAIFSYGHRNPQGMAMHPETGEIWAHEHGPRGGDEINLVQKGKNYGWPEVTYGRNYSGTQITPLTKKAGTEQPLWHWTPSIAPSGMSFITSDKYPEWKGHLISGSLKFSYLVLCRLDGNKVVSHEVLFDGIGRLRNVIQGSDGYLYIATDSGKIVKVVPDNEVTKK